MKDDLIPTKPSYNPMAEGNLNSLVCRQEEEINLIDVLRVLIKRKTLILTTAFLVTLLGLLYALLKTDIYTYSSAIEIGSLSIHNSEKPLANAKNIVSEANALVIPAVLGEYYAKNPNQEKNLKIKASTPKDSEIVILSANSSEKDSSIYKELLTLVGNQLMSEQNKKIEAHNSQLALQISNAQKRLATLLVSENETNKRLDSFQKLFKTSPLDNSGTTTLVITELFGQLQAINGEQYSLETQIANMEADQKFTSFSLFLSPFSRSIDAINGDKKIVIISSMIGGLFLGIFIAITLNYIERAKAELKCSS